MSRPVSTVQYSNKGRVVIVTGGGQGIGLAVCKRFRDSGATA